MQKDERKAFSAEELEIAVYDGLFYKQKYWKYEKEWRIVRRMDEGEEYLHYHPDDLAAVMITKRRTMIANIFK